MPVCNESIKCKKRGNIMKEVSGVDIEKELRLLEQKVELLVKNGIITLGQLDIISGRFATKEALIEINKQFQEIYESKRN